MIPAIAMMAYITLETMLVAPPKMDATRSNSNSPTNPQFNAPTIVRNNAIFCNVDIFFPPLFLFIIMIVKFHENIHE